MSDLPPLPPPPQASSAAPETLAEIVELARRQNYSDIHLGVGEQPRFRERGEIISSGWPVTEAVQFDRWLSEVLSSAERERFRSEHDFDGSFAFERVRVRINLMESLRGPAMVLRLIPQTILSLEELQLPEVLKTLANRPKGLTTQARVAATYRMGILSSKSWTVSYFGKTGATGTRYWS